MELKTLENLEWRKVLSLIAGFAGSMPAKDGIMEILPFRDPDRIKRNLDETEDLLSFLKGSGSIPVNGIRDIRPELERLEKSSDILTGDELLKIRADIEVGKALRKAFTLDSSRPGVMRPGLLGERAGFIPTLSRIHQMIVDSIDEKGEVRDDASPRLATIRRDLVKTRQEIEKRLTELLSSGSDIFQDRFYTLRNDRYVVPVKSSEQGQIQGIVHDQSGSGQTLFLEPLEMLGMNNRLVRLRIDEKEEVLRILRSMSEALREAGTDLRELFSTIVFFDQVNARARFAVKFDAYRPVIPQDGRLILKNARHPLLHPGCVPLDLEMDVTRRCVVITGPNGGGKTVALKIVGINSLLLQGGFYALAGADSQIPVFDQVLADIGESQSIESHLSTFTSHLTRLKEIYTGAAKGKSLVLIDEIGTGTDPSEGAALAHGFLKELTRQGVFSMVTSHFDALKEIAFTTPGFMNAGMEFDYQTLRPTFRFSMGVPGKSNALAIARLFGLPEEVLAELARFRGGALSREAELFEALETEKSRAESLRRACEERERRIAEKEGELDESLERLKEFRRKKRDEFSEKYESDLRKKIREFETLIHDLRLRAGEKLPSADLSAAREGREGVKALLDRLEDEGGEASTAAREAGPVRLGDAVFWGTMLVPGRLVEMEPGRDRVTVEFEGKRMTVPQSELRKAPTKLLLESEPAPPPLTGPRAYLPPELDLRGLRADEAVTLTEQYLKSAKASDHGKVRIIHGKGTGALQRAIHEYLKRSEFRKIFRFGRYGEGDLGVTVVVFRPEEDDDNPFDTRNPKNLPAPKVKKGRKNS